jgi:hypothetical protein
MNFRRTSFHLNFRHQNYYPMTTAQDWSFVPDENILLVLDVEPALSVVLVQRLPEFLKACSVCLKSKKVVTMRNQNCPDQKSLFFHRVFVYLDLQNSCLVCLLKGYICPFADHYFRFYPFRFRDRDGLCD